MIKGVQSDILPYLIPSIRAILMKLEAEKLDNLQ